MGRCRIKGCARKNCICGYGNVWPTLPILQYSQKTRKENASLILATLNSARPTGFGEKSTLGMYEHHTSYFRGGSGLQLLSESW